MEPRALTTKALTISVLNTPTAVITYQKTEQLWAAIGEHNGRLILIYDQTEARAVERWRDAATLQGI